MFISETVIRVRYAETDQMGYVYYGNYATYFEVARVEAMKELGVSYKELEEQGIIMPVLSYSSKYYKPALYDDALTIKTSITELPNVRIHFSFEVFNAEGVKLNDSKATLVFVDSSSGKACAAPEHLLNTLKPYYK